MKNFNIYFGIYVAGLKIAFGVLAIFILIVAFDNTMNMALKFQAGILLKTAVFALIAFYFVAAFFVLRFIFNNIRRCIAAFRS